MVMTYKYMYSARFARRRARKKYRPPFRSRAFCTKNKSANEKAMLYNHFETRSSDIKSTRYSEILSVTKPSLDRMNPIRNNPKWHRQRGSASWILMLARSESAIGNGPQISYLSLVCSQMAAGQKSCHINQKCPQPTPEETSEPTMRVRVHRTFMRLGWDGVKSNVVCVTKIR